MVLASARESLCVCERERERVRARGKVVFDDVEGAVTPTPL